MFRGPHEDYSSEDIRNKPGKPEWVTIFDKAPARITGRLRTLHQRRYPERLQFVEAIHKHFLAGLLKSKLPIFIREDGETDLVEVLWNIAAELEMYRGFSNVYYLSVIYTILRMFCRHLMRQLDERVEGTTTKALHFLKLSEPTWNALYEDLPMTMLQSKLPSHEFQRPFTLLLAETFRLHLKIYNEPPDFYEVYMAQIALFAWTGAIKGGEFNLANEPLFVVDASLREISQEELDVFRNHTILSQDEIVLTSFVKAFLTHTGAVDQELLSSLTLISDLMMHESVGNKRAEEKSFAERVLISCRTQLCSGDETFTWSILNTGLHFAADILEHDQPPQETVDPRSTIFLLTRSALIAAQQSSAEDIEGWEYFLRCYASVVDRLDDVLDDWKGSFTCDLVSPWLTTAERLGALDTQDAPLQETVLASWLQFGLNFDLPNPVLPCSILLASPACDSVGPILYNTSHYIGSIRTIHCHWKECPCSYSVTDHPVRRCGGCLDVFYCSTRCQTRDWREGGHKQVCGGRKRRNGARRCPDTLCNPYVNEV